MSKHTEGPWEVNEETIGGRVVARIIGARYPGGYKPIATLSSGFTYFAEDARLIAAAPDLLEALIFLVKAKDAKDRHGDTEVYRSLKADAWDQARSAIAKAEGGGE